MGYAFTRSCDVVDWECLAECFNSDGVSCFDTTEARTFPIFRLQFNHLTLMYCRFASTNAVTMAVGRRKKR